jgi:hypothetical protein
MIIRVWQDPVEQSGYGKGMRIMDIMKRETSRKAPLAKRTKERQAKQLKKKSYHAPTLHHSHPTHPSCSEIRYRACEVEPHSFCVLHAQQSPQESTRAPAPAPCR